MNGARLSADISDMIKRLGATDELPEIATAIRFVVAADWSRVAVPLTVLKAFRAIVPSASGVQLAFAVPHEPTATDAECVLVLSESIDGGIDDIELVSFDEAAREPYDSAVVPDRDPEALIVQVGGLIVRMHDVVRRLDRVQAGGSLADATLNRGSGDALHRRFASFVG